MKTGSYNNNKHVRDIHFCPWCAKTIPSRLNKEYFDILEKEYDIEVPDLENFSNVPEDFKSDLWWIKRNL